MDGKASASLPESDPLYAPGLKRRNRKTSRLWIPPAKDIKAGWLPRTIAFDPDLSELDVAARCRTMWAELVDWRAGMAPPTNFTLKWLVSRYLGDKTSPFQKLGVRAQRSYRHQCAIIAAEVGERRIDHKLVGGEFRARIIGEDVRRWHAAWGEPLPLLDDEGQPLKDAAGEPLYGPPRASRARHLIVMLRLLVAYAVELDVPGSIALRTLLTTMRFKTVPARDSYATREQVYAIVAEAVKQKRRSIAITTLAQFELIERRTHIIGTWVEKDQWAEGWEWNSVGPHGYVGISADWVVTYYQLKTMRTLREFDLKTIPPLLALLQEIPQAERAGPVIVCETTGKPWRERHYAETFREIARAAGVPDSVWSMDMRPGGATEADAIPEISDRAFNDAGGWTDPRSRDRYRRQRQVNAQNVVNLRQKAAKP